MSFLASYGLGLFESDGVSGARERLVWLYTGVERELRGVLAHPVPAPASADDPQRLASSNERHRLTRLGEAALGIAERAWTGYIGLIERSAIIGAGVAGVDITDPDEVGAGPGLAFAAPERAADPGALSAVEAQLQLAERAVREARFEYALRTAQGIEGLLDQPPGAHADDDARARLELIRATAHIAFGNADQVQQALRRALAASPGLELDRATTAPKLLRAFETARAQPTGSG